MRKKIFLMIILLICLGACRKSIDLGEVNQNEFSEDEVFSFYVAGHTYGTPSKRGTEEQDNMHPPFTRFLPEIAKDETIEFGILTGDTVYIPSERSYSNLIAAMGETEKPYYIAPGNHDLSNGGSYFDEYFEERNQSFLMENNLFIILTPIANWSIADEQLKMITEVIKNNPEVDNIFVFTHQLIWLEKDTYKGFEEFQPNSWAGKDLESNFWDEVIPLFSDFNRCVWFIAGDIGAFSGRTNPVVKHVDNFHYIASGMGGYQTDNILKISIFENGEVTISAIYLNNLIEKGKAYFSRSIPEWIDNFKKIAIKVFNFLGIDYRSIRERIFS